MAEHITIYRVDNRRSPLRGWWAVADDGVIVAYARSEQDAERIAAALEWSRSVTAAERL